MRRMRGETGRLETQATAICSHAAAMEPWSAHQEARRCALHVRTGHTRGRREGTCSTRALAWACSMYMVVALSGSVVSAWVVITQTRAAELPRMGIPRGTQTRVASMGVCYAAMHTDCKARPRPIARQTACSETATAARLPPPKVRGLRKASVTRQRHSLTHLNTPSTLSLPRLPLN